MNAFCGRRQAGAYLLEVLIGILIFSLGILGIVGLQAASLRSTTEAGLRAEAVFAANQFIGQMWADNESNLEASYSSALGGAAYQSFAAELKAAQGGAWVQDPDVVFDDNRSPSATSKYVTVRILWKVCQDPTDPTCASPTINPNSNGVHNYTTSAVIGQNE